MATYRFGNRIGSGGFGEVFHVTRVEDGVPFAAKRLLAEHVSDEDVVKRFRREVRLQRGISHPNVLPVVEANLSASPPWFVMPIAARTLLHEIQGGLTEMQVDRLFLGVLAGVQHAHESNVIHRDLKPENVMLTYDGTPQVSDFGLGKDLYSDTTVLTKTQVGIGSFPYVAPEQMIDLRSVDHRADIYALGKILQVMLTNRLPVMHPDPNVPQKYQWFIARCCAQSPEDRYQSLEEVVAAFNQVARGVERPEPPVEVAERLIEEWRELPVGADLEKLRELHEHLEQNAKARDLFRAVVPRLPAGIVADYAAFLPHELARLVELYDSHIDETGGLPFEYCDVVADFYARVFGLTRDLAVRRRILARLVNLGASHNRYHVGSVVADILGSLVETEEVMMAVDVLRADSRHAVWLKDRPKVRDTAFAQAIDDVLFGEL